MSTLLKTRKSAPGESQAPEIRRLSSLLEVSQALSGTLNLKSAMHNVLEILARHHGAVRGIVTLLHEGGELRVEASDGLEKPGAPVKYRVGEGDYGPRRRDRPAGRRAARQQRADAAASRLEASGAARAGAELRLRADHAEPQGDRRPVDRPQVQAGPRLRSHRQVSRRRRLDAGAGDQDSAAHRGGSPPARGRKHAPAAGAPRALRLLEHHRHERAGAADVRAGGAGRRRPTPPSSSAASRAPGRS